VLAARVVQTTVCFAVGFNPVALARKTPIELWSDRKTNNTFFEVASRLQSKQVTVVRMLRGSLTLVCLQGDGHHFILNPIVGPEPITGSSRMKVRIAAHSQQSQCIARPRAARPRK
jgi:hypothetical protein